MTSGKGRARMRKGKRGREMERVTDTAIYRVRQRETEGDINRARERRIGEMGRGTDNEKPTGTERETYGKRYRGKETAREREIEREHEKERETESKRQRGQRDRQRQRNK